MHNLLLVIGEGDLAALMSPFSEYLEVKEYEAGEVSESDKTRMLDYYQTTRGFQSDSFDACYEGFGEDWNGNAWKKDSDGVWHEYSTANPDGQWDWYEVGGRWAGRIQLKDGVKPIAPVNFSWGWSDEDKNSVLNAKPARADVARLEDVANLDELFAGAVLINGEWIDNEDASDNYHYKPVRPFLEGLPGDTLIRFVDYHS